MDARDIAIIGVHVMVALLFAAMAVVNVLNGDVINAVMQGVIAALVVGLGVSLSRII